MEEPLEERLMRYMTRREYEPQDRSAIARGMGVSSGERAELRALLARLESEKKLLRLRGARLVPAGATQSSYTGTIRALPRGRKLFFVPHEEGQRALAPHMPGEDEEVRIPIAHGRSMGGLEGDVVRASVRRRAPLGYRRRGKGLRPAAADELPLEARVEEVLHRRCELWVGALAWHGRVPYVQGDGRSAPERIRLSVPPPPEAAEGMLVSVVPESPAEGRGRIAEVLGYPDDRGVDMAALIRRYGLRDEFPAAVLQEMQQLPAVDKAGREDWTRRCVVTIDPPTARDFDDAICLERSAEGWELAVHIADVSFYVRPGSAADSEARRRGNSTYLPDRVLPMLPPRLSDDLCSLVQGEERLTMLCHMSISPEGVVRRARLARAVICSRLRLDYPRVQALLEQGASCGNAEVDAMLLEANKVAQLLRRKRFEAGALNLDMPELRVLTDAEGRTVGFTKEEGDASHSLIEECMLAANEQVARLLRERTLPGIYRVHEEPAADKWRELVHTLREGGVAVSAMPGRRELARVLESLSGHPEEQRLKVAVLRSMMRARYATRPLGHFGLAKGDYCHFTSPIRRYADLVVHRSVERMLGSSAALLPPGRAEQLAEHLSETERVSAAAESEAVRLKLLQYLEAQASAAEPLRLHAVVCGLWAHGLALEAEELPLRGYLPASLMPRSEGWYYAGREWRNRAGVRWTEGSRLEVVPHAVDWDTLSVELRPAPPAGE